MGVLDIKAVTTISIKVKHQMLVDYIKECNPKFKLSKFLQEKLDEEMEKYNFNPYEVIRNGPD